MRKYVILLVCMVISGMVFGQNETKMLDVKEVKVTPPKFAGITTADVLKENNSSLINNFLMENVVHPDNQSAWLIEGTEIIHFTVTPQGTLTNFEIINSVSSAIDKEMIRVLKTTNGMWNPGYNNGVLTAMEYEVTIMFGDNTDGKITNRFISKASNHFKQGGNNLMKKDNPEKALRSYNQGIRYLPNDESLLLMRGICYYELGETEKAKKDWNRLASLGGVELNEIVYDISAMKGFPELTQMIKNK